MTISAYLKDQKWLIFTFLIMIAFITTVMLLEPSLQIDISNLVYLELIALFIFLTYLTIHFIRKKEFLENVTKVVEHGDYSSLPKAQTFEELAFLSLFKQQNEKQLQHIHKLNDEKKEWLEYMTMWFHEIKTPIAVSKMLYESDTVNTSLAEEMDKIERFVDQALYYSRLSEFNKDYLIQEVSIEKIVKEVVKMNAKPFISKNIKLHLSPYNLEVLTDQKALHFVINQIIKNSLKYTPVNGELTVTIKPEERTITIRDSGIGITPEDLPRVFEKGFTGKNGREYHRSTGMGLYLSKKMAEKLNHVLEIKSELYSFTEVVIKFPNSDNQYYT